MAENERLSELMARLARLESDVCKYEDKFNDLVSSVNTVSMSIHELSTRIETAVKTILIGFGLISTLSGAFWVYQKDVDRTHESIMRETNRQVLKNNERLSGDYK